MKIHTSAESKVIALEILHLNHDTIMRVSILSNAHTEGKPGSAIGIWTGKTETFF